MIIDLISQRLQYGKMSTPLVHVRIETTSVTPGNPHYRMLCGIQGVYLLLSAREMDVSKLCKRCYATLRTYSEQFVKAR